MNSVRLVSENGVSNIQKKLWYVDNSSEINLDNFAAGDRIYSINDNKLYQVEYDTSTEQEYSGEIVSFEADEDDRISSVIAEIKPIQDLHGYDNPWPGGGGKNLFNPQYFLDAGCVLENGYYKGTHAQIGAAIVAFNDNFTFEENTRYALSYTIRSDAGVYFRLLFKYNDNTSSQALPNSSTTDQLASVVSTANKNVASLGRDFSNIGTVWVKDVQLEKSETVTTYSPFSNLCPISGWTGVTVNRCGADYTKTGQTNGYRLDGSGGLVASAAYTTTDYIDVHDSSKIFFGSTWDSSAWIWRVAKFNSNKEFISETDLDAMQGSADISLDVGDEYYVRISVPYLNVSCYAYAGEAISVNWEDEAGTVYKGTLTLNPDGTGTLVVDRDLYNLASWNSDRIAAYNWNGTSGIYFSYVFATVQNRIDGLCNMARVSTTSQELVSNAPFMWFGINTGHVYWVGILDALGIESVADFVTWLRTSGLQITRPILNPQPVQLTASEVSGILTTLYGQNNVWTDAGEINVKVIKNDITAFELKPYN